MAKLTRERVGEIARCQTWTVPERDGLVALALEALDGRQELVDCKALLAHTDGQLTAKWDERDTARAERDYARTSLNGMFVERDALRAQLARAEAVVEAVRHNRWTCNGTVRDALCTYDGVPRERGRCCCETHGMGRPRYHSHCQQHGDGQCNQCVAARVGGSPYHTEDVAAATPAPAGSEGMSRGERCGDVFIEFGVAGQIPQRRACALAKGHEQHRAQAAAPAAAPYSGPEPAIRAVTEAATRDDGQGLDLPHGALEVAPARMGGPLFVLTAHYDDVVALAERVERIERALRHLAELDVALADIDAILGGTEA